MRKLAERAGASTKEITGLIRTIQATVSDAVEAMEKSTLEVQNGARHTGEAGKALENIQAAADAVREQVDQASNSVEQMGKVSHDLASAAREVSTIVARNAKATQEMSSGSVEITKAIENIASVSEENSAAVEEVSASTEEMSAQIEEVTASAHELATMAQDLREIVGEFQLPKQASTAVKGMSGKAMGKSNGAKVRGGEYRVLDLA